MKILKFYILLLIYALTVNIGSSQTTPGEIYQKGMEAYYGANFDVGINYFTEYIKIAPTDANGFKYRGLCYQGKKDYQRAIEDFSSVIRMAPTTAEGYINRGNTYIMMNNLSSAERDFKDAVKYESHNIEGYIGLSRIEIAKNNFKGAEKQLSSAIAVDPKNARLFIAQAYVNFLEGDTVKIVDNFAQAMYWDSSVVFTDHNRELLQIKLESYKKALKIADQKIQQNKYSYMAYFSRGMIYFLMNNYKSARSDFKKAQELYKGNDQKLEALFAQVIRSVDRNSNK
ncbi:MAG TPA: tetratricopeptide repeat protein [Ignavibacteria bacterium]|nr:tetratricopeptide repeat protein [Ignavibacteria bacterium]HMR41059.1 tetratricopeptide repeat protein [Ignavibacteria bacterium]